MLAHGKEVLTKTQIQRLIIKYNIYFNQEQPIPAVLCPGMRMSLVQGCPWWL